jgi:hypothetical protein
MSPFVVATAVDGLSPKRKSLKVRLGFIGPNPDAPFQAAGDSLASADAVSCTPWTKRIQLATESP